MTSATRPWRFSMNRASSEMTVRSTERNMALMLMNCSRPGMERKGETSLSERDTVILIGCNSRCSMKRNCDLRAASRARRVLMKAWRMRIRAASLLALRDGWSAADKNASRKSPPHAPEAARSGGTSAAGRETPTRTFSSSSLASKRDSSSA